MAPYTGFSQQRQQQLNGGAIIVDDLELLLENGGALEPPEPIQLPPQSPDVHPPGIAALIQQAVIQGGAANERNAPLSSLKLCLTGGFDDLNLQRLGLCLPNLQELILDESYLPSLRDLGTGMSRLRILRVSRCGLTSLDGLWGLESLRELYVAHNPAVKDIWSCAALPKLRQLDLAYSGVRNVDVVGFLAPCSHLRALTLLGSPAALQDPVAYRVGVRRQLPNLVTLDGRQLVASEELRSESDTSGDSPREVDDGFREPPSVGLRRTSSLHNIPKAPPPGAPRQRRNSSCSGDNIQRQQSATPVTPTRPRSAINVSNPYAASIRRRSFTGEVSNLLAHSEDSGGMVSGPGGVLPAALRRLERTPVPCWVDLPRLSSSSDEQTRSAEPGTSWAGQVDEDQLLVEARQWRQEYSRFRQENSKRWNEDERRGVDD